MHARITGHINSARRGGKTCFLRALSKYGVAEFDFEILEECEISELMERERFYIALMNAASLDGFNTREKPDAGNIYGQVSEATRARIGAASKGRVFSPEVRALLSAKRKGKRITQEQRAKISAANTGKKRTLEQRERMSMAKKNPSAETRAKIGNARRGRPHTPEQRAKISASGIGRIQTESEKLKRAAWHLGKKRTDEQRERMRLAQLNMSPEKKARSDAARHKTRSPECRARMSAGRKAANLARRALL